MAEIGTGPLWRVDGPPPLRPIYGLLQAADTPSGGVRIIPDADGGGVERWGNGVEVWPYPPDLADVFNSCAPGSEAYIKGDGSEIETPQFNAMTVWLPETCSASRIPNQEEFKARAVAVMTAVESAAVAYELLSGARLPRNPHLSDGNGTFPNDDDVTSVLNGLALLEGEIAKSGRQGLIHISPMVAVIARNVWGISSTETPSGLLRTANGTVVIPDAGYVWGASPHNHAEATDTEEWIYATGPIDVRRSEIVVVPDRVEDALDRGMGATNDKPNSITYRVERDYVVDWDTEVQAAVLVDRCQTGCTA